MKFTKLLTIAALVSSLMIVPACSSLQLFHPKKYKDTQFLMDTIIEITAYGEHSETAIQKAMDEIKRIQDLSNQFNESSQVSQINAMAGKSPVIVDKDLIIMLKIAANRAAKLEGALDVTIGPLTNLWGIGRKDDFIPAQDEINALLPLVNYRLIEIDTDKNTVFLPQTGMRLDLGAVAKEYATLRAFQILKETGITSALVNAGGNIRTIGLRPGGNPWRIGVQDPRKQDGVKAKLSMTEWDLLETSGDYQRFFEKGGMRYAHILDPHTGKQPRELASVTIISNSADDNYMLATALFVLGIEKGQKLLQQFPGTQVMWVTLENKVIITPGLEGKLELNQ